MVSHNSFESGCACIDGDYVPLSEARIPLTDMGFLRCDATYDVVAVWKRKYFRLNDHFERFEASWQRLRMSPPLSRGEMREILDECVRRIEVEDAYVAMILSRGMALPGVRDPRVMQNRFYAYATPYVWIVKPEEQEVGTHVVVCKETVRISNEAVDPKVKNFHWGDMVRGLFEAYDRGGYTAVLTDADGNTIKPTKDKWTPGTMHIHDLNATILHQLGIDHKRLTYRYQGRDFRLTDVHGHVIHDIIT